MKATANELQFRWFTAAAIVLTGFIAYTNTFSNEFVWDDASSILLHKHVQDPAKIGQLFREDLHAFGRGQGNFYRPLLAVSFMADYAWAFDGKTEAGVPQPAVFPFHLTSTILHVGAALWLLALLCRMRAPRSVFLAVPLLWVVHPLHTEAVAYISGRGDSMAAFFMFAALWFGLWEGSPRKRVAGMILSGLFFVAAVLSKESALVLPFLYLPLLVWAPRADGTKPAKSDRIGRLPPIGIMTAILIVYAFLRTTVLNFGSDSAAPAAGLTARLLETGQAVAMYTKLIFVPTGLHMERSLAGAPAWLGLVGLLILLAIVAVSIGAVVRGHSRIAAAGAWFLITWFPISGIIPLNAPMAEHWLYVPLAGALWMLLEIAGLTFSAKPMPYVCYTAVYLCCLVLIALTVERNSDWRTNETLYVATLKDNPTSIRVHYNLAATYQDLLDNPAGARRHFERVIQLYQEKKDAEGLDKSIFWDDELDAHLSLGDILMEIRPDQAMEHYARVLSVSPEGERKGLVGMAAFGMGRCSLRLGQFEQAEQFFKKAIVLIPELKTEADRMLSRGI
ncbi:MAG TPA: tetratricopeptide repeat protein [Candidatus Hydrogenedentes bacterium]|nr:tetratricopeptide repeat protein [Candidatus Hydrogenedentota bacterium]HQE82406.1 tetratricopeptide repeat protein [Candidatus Hydrogenedentota bacterium]HQH51049.1 tetratricopeptide repeat protein [Candidatus Hydrogenedentota bacterium]HQM48771.1 tetratricopeptide repeat protein [Candidatus Hydrogenedentota bacterium]